MLTRACYAGEVDSLVRGETMTTSQEDEKRRMDALCRLRVRMRCLSCVSTVEDQKCKNTDPDNMTRYTAQSRLGGGSMAMMFSRHRHLSAG